MTNALTIRMANIAEAAARPVLFPGGYVAELVVTRVERR